MSADTAAVVFLHPIALDSSASQWLHVSGLVSPTLLSHGGRMPRGTFSLDEMADEVLGWTDGPVHLVGCSMGGMVAMRFALRHPERTASLMLGYTTGRINPERMRERADDWNARADQLIDAIMERWFTPESLAEPSLAAPVSYARDRLSKTPASVMAASWRAIADHDVLDRLGELSGIPTTVVGGRRDESTPLSAVEALAAAIPGSRLAINDDPHMGFLESPDSFTDVLLDHLGHAGRAS